jgi:O-antigen/teichoic acid export membrane protein
MDLLAVLDVFYKVMSLLGVAAVVLLDLGFYALVAALSLAAFVWFCSSFLVSRRFWTINFRPAPRVMRKLVRDSIGIWLITIVGLLHFQGDMVLLSLLQPPSEVGIYAIAYKFIEQAFLIPGLLMSAIFPILVRRVHTNGQSAMELVRRLSSLLLLLGISLSLLVFVMAPDLVRLVASGEFAPAAEPLRVASLALPAIFVSMIYFNILIVLNRQRTLIVISLSSLALNMILNLYFIPRYSYMGAAWVTVGTELFACLFTFLFARRAYGVGLDFVFLRRVAVPTALGALTAWLTRDLPGMGSAAAALAIFALGVVASRALTTAEIRLMFGR